MIGFTGSRAGMTEAQVTALTNLLREQPEGTRLHHGCCVGADLQAHLIASRLGLHTVGHPANDVRESEMAPVIPDESWPAAPALQRNHDIVDESAVLIAAPSGPERLRSGTWATIRYARKHDVLLKILWPNGEVTDK